jgi:Na+-driven multidrug efflux pump
MKNKIFDSNITVSKAEDLRMISIARFYVPVVFANFIASFIYPIFSSGISKFPDVHESLAAFSVSRSLYFVFASLILVLSQTVVALVKDDHSYKLMKKFIFSILVISFGVFVIVGATPLSRLVFRDMMGVEDKFMAHTRRSFLIFSLLTILSGLNLSLQGLTIITKRTMNILYAMIAQIAVVYLSLLGLSKLLIFDGASSATISYIIGTAASVAVLYFLTYRHFRETLSASVVLQEDIDKDKAAPLSVKSILLFYLPLVFGMIISNNVITFINAALTRSHDAVLFVGAFDIGWSVAWLALGCVQAAHQVPLVYLRRGETNTYKKTAQFLLVLGLICSLAIAVLGFTPAGSFVLISLMGIPHDVSEQVIGLLKALTLLPLLQIIRQYFWGVLMAHKDTGPVTWGKVIHLLTIILFIQQGSYLKFNNPAAAIGIGMLIAEFVEIIYFLIRTKKYFRFEQETGIYKEKETLGN